MGNQNRVQTAQKLASIAQEYDLDPEEFVRIASQETGGKMDAQARNKTGAAGLFQIMPDVAKAEGIDPYDVEQSARYTAEQMQKTGKSGYDYYRAHNQGVAGDRIISEWLEGGSGSEAARRVKAVKTATGAERFMRTVERNIMDQPIMKDYQHVGDRRMLAQEFVNRQRARYQAQPTYLTQSMEFADKSVDAAKAAAANGMAAEAVANDPPQPPTGPENMPSLKETVEKLKALQAMGFDIE